MFGRKGKVLGVFLSFGRVLQFSGLPTAGGIVRDPGGIVRDPGGIGRDPGGTVRDLLLPLLSRPWARRRPVPPALLQQWTRMQSIKPCLHRGLLC